MYRKCSTWICGCVLIVSVANANQADRETAVEHTVDKLVRLLQQRDDAIDRSAVELSDERMRDQLVKDIKAVRQRTKGKQVSSVELDRTTGRSGLRDFHDIPSDKNPDHSWIDRDEAVNRIMTQKLLFVPGKGRRHSHSAWGLLAAVIEVVSKQTYPEFTRENLFGPAGMKDTGFFGDPVPEERIAVGYGSQKSSDPNSPPHWGQTSWLVMGSGGQVSTLADMYRWEVAMRNGSILSPESTKIYIGDGNGVSQDGDMFGFEFIHSKNPDQLVMILSNAVNTRQDRKAFDQLGRRLLALVRKQ